MFRKHKLYMLNVQQFFRNMFIGRQKFLTIYNVHIGVHLKMTERDLANLRCIFDLFKAGDFFGTLLYIFTFLKVN
jgi:hypothetical protein